MQIHPSHALMVTGSRSFTDVDAARRALTQIWERWGTIPAPLLISGTARGADRLLESLFESAGLPVRRFPADWDREGRAAGLRRNERMLDELVSLRERGVVVGVLGLTVLCSPCPKNHTDTHVTHGTAHALDSALRRGLPIATISSGDSSAVFLDGVAHPIT